MALCCLKNAEFEKAPTEVQGPACVEGDNIRDKDGLQAVFTEQGAGASQMVAAKSLDVVARMPGTAGSAADCVSAYTQVKNADMARLLKLPRNKCPVVWIRIPKDRWPKWWHEKGLVDPVVPLLVNLYGHPLAGLLWEKTCGREARPEWVEKLHSWECIYYHRKDQLFLDAYVDDLKIVGKAEHIKPMWESLRKSTRFGP